MERCVRELWNASGRACDEEFPQDLAPLARLYLRGQVSVATYFACEGIRKLMRDVFSDRDLTLKTIEAGFDWTISEVLPGNPKIERGDEPDEFIMVMGGLYELIYVYLTRGDVLDVATCALPCIMVFGRMFEVDVNEDELKAYALDRTQLDRLSHRALELVPW
ncbi:MAG: hypothetical protein Q4B54_07860 [Coriobacteriales bacterium]|nr:hypothetical protein [Coriobacteriales bacterium]